jgi:hypothetical protein
MDIFSKSKPRTAMSIRSAGDPPEGKEGSVRVRVVAFLVGSVLAITLALLCSTVAAASSGTPFVSKRNGYSIVLPGSTARWLARYASDNWTDRTIPGIGDPQLDNFQDNQTGRVYLIASRPATSLRAWTKFVASAHPSVCSAARTLPASTVGGSPARVLTWSCSDGYQVFVLTADHAHRGYMLLVASPTLLSRASDWSALDTARRSFKFLQSVG